MLTAKKTILSTDAVYKFIKSSQIDQYLTQDNTGEVALTTADILLFGWQIDVMDFIAADSEKAFELYQLAAKQGNLSAKKTLSLFAKAKTESAALTGEIKNMLRLMQAETATADHIAELKKLLNPNVKLASAVFAFIIAERITQIDYRIQPTLTRMAECLVDSNSSPFIGRFDNENFETISPLVAFFKGCFLHDLPLSSEEKQQLIQFAARRMFAQAEFHLFMHYKDRRVEAQRSKGYQYLERAAMHGCATAALELAMVFFYKGDAELGNAWLRKSCLVEHPDALIEQKKRQKFAPLRQLLDAIFRNEGLSFNLKKISKEIKCADLDQIYLVLEYLNAHQIKFMPHELFHVMHHWIESHPQSVYLTMVHGCALRESILPHIKSFLALLEVYHGKAAVGVAQLKEIAVAGCVDATYALYLLSREGGKARGLTHRHAIDYLNLALAAKYPPAILQKADILWFGLETDIGTFASRRDEALKYYAQAAELGVINPVIFAEKKRQKAEVDAHLHGRSTQKASDIQLPRARSSSIGSYFNFFGSATKTSEVHVELDVLQSADERAKLRISRSLAHRTSYGT